MIYYHATEFTNLSSILENGIHPGCDGEVYLCKKPEEALRFVVIRNIGTHKKYLVCKVDLRSGVEESFDHSEEFFRCRAYMYNKNIPSSNIRSYIEYDI